MENPQKAWVKEEDELGCKSVEKVKETEQWGLLARLSGLGFLLVWLVIY